jgi:hypothetical protein
MSQTWSLGRRSPQSLAYRVVAQQAVRAQLHDAPAELQGYIAGVVAVLRVDPVAVSAAFETRYDDDVRTALFAGGRGFLTYWVIERRRAVILLNVTWAAWS